MKSKLIPLAAAVASVVAISAHATGPIDGSVYGKLRLSDDYVKTQKTGKPDDSQNILKSHASRIGFKGKSALTDYNDLNVIYQAEYGIDGQVNNGNNWSARNTFVGLQGGFGTILAGRHDTPFKGSQGHVDEFNDLDGDMASIFNGEDRLNQMVMYTTPAIGPVTAQIAYVASNKSDSNIKNAPSHDGVSAAVMADLGMVYGALAYNNDINNQNSFRVTGVFKPVEHLQLGAMWQQTKCNNTNLSTTTTTTSNATATLPDGNGGQVVVLTPQTVTSTSTSAVCKGVDGANPGDSENGYLVSAGYTMGKAKVMAEYASSDMYKISQASYKQDISVGASYKLSKKTNLEGWYTQLKNNYLGQKTTYVALGLQHKF